MPRDNSNPLSNLAAQLNIERAGIPADVDAAIADFLANANKHLADKVIKSIKAYGDTKTGFAAWQNFLRDEDYIALRKSVHDLKISMRKAYGMSSVTVKEMQRQDRKKTYMPHRALGRSLMSAFNLVAGSTLAGNNRGGLSFRQEMAFEGFVAAHIMYAEPGASIEPLTAVLAPYLRKAVAEKLAVSYESLKKQSGKPLLDEEIVRSLRGQILETAYARFDKLAEELRAPQVSSMQSYDFDAEQMPKDARFGVEFEAFIPNGQKYPANIMTLSKTFNELGLSAATAMMPKQDSTFDKWRMTADSSIINPLNVNGRYKISQRLNGGGAEIVSPVLSGVIGAKLLQRAERLLQDLQFRTNSSCGLHVHVDMSRTTLAEQKNIVKALCRNEEALDALVAPERRDTPFARSIRGTDLAAVDAAATTEELVALVNPHNDRNYKFDFTGLVTENAPPTLQYRAAGGAGYLGTAGDYTIILCNFTKQALTDPNIKLNDVISNLSAQKHGMRPQPAATRWGI